MMAEHISKDPNAIWDECNRLISDLRVNGEEGAAQHLEDALRGGAVRSEILGRCEHAIEMLLKQGALQQPHLLEQIKQLHSKIKTELRRFFV
jgi:hypothetical protein